MSTVARSRASRICVQRGSPPRGYPRRYFRRHGSRHSAMADSQYVQLQQAPSPKSRRRWLLLISVFAIELILLGVPWWTLLSAGTRWPAAVVAVGTLAFVGAFVGLPASVVVGHGRRHRDWAAVTGDVLLGAMWVLFVWSVLAQLLRLRPGVVGLDSPPRARGRRLALLVFGVDDPIRSRVVAIAVVVVVVALLAWGYVEAMRVPRTRL